ncbi:MAG: carboxypeptidase regulatory-like domain-containing protein [Prevotella sp.]|nr:carboxypeptidase regulatory-like domain-containing protein [Prevotella sp.]
MKKNIFIMAMMSALTALPAISQADVIDNYTYNFETAYGETAAYGGYYNDSQASPAGWAHIADDGGTGSFPSYSFAQGKGTNGSNCLQVGSQQAFDEEYEEYVDTRDMLVTPGISGEMTIMAKNAGYTAGSVRFYKVTLSGGKYRVGEELMPTESVTLNRTDFQRLRLTSLAEGTYVGILASNVLLDDFTATTAEVTVRPELKIVSATSKMPKYQDTDAQGDFTVKYMVKLENTGQIDIKAGDKGYELSLFYIGSLGNDTIATYPVNIDLAKGESKEVEFTHTINIKDFPAKYSYRLNIAEGISGSNVYGSYVQLVPYSPVLKVESGETSQAYEDGAGIAFGTSQQPVTRSLNIKNDGAKALNLTTITMPEGFITNIKAPLTIAPHSSLKMTLTMPIEKFGPQEGDMLLDGDRTFRLHLTGTAINPTAWFVDFESRDFPANMLAGKGWEITNYPDVAGYKGNKYSATCKEATGRLVSPLLTVAQGEKLQLMAARTDGQSAMTVYCSADRVTWTPVRTITASDLPAEVAYQNYSSSFYKFSTVEIEGIPAGEQYLAFETGSVNIDNITGFRVTDVAHDLIITAAAAPASITNNHAAKARVSVRNLSLNNEPAGDYTLSLYMDGEKVASAITSELGSGKQADYDLDFIPNHVGTFTLKATVTDADGKTFQSDDMPIEVKQEVAMKDVVIGESNGETAGAAPVSQANYSQAEILITKDMIGSQLSSGSRILAVSFTGRATKDASGHLHAWIENTEDDACASNADTPYDTGSMTEIANAGYAVQKTDSGTLITIQLASPFEYTGTNLRLMFDNSAWNVSSWSPAFTFDVTDNTTAMTRNGWSSTYYGADFSETATPVVTFSIAKEASILSGRVTSKATGAAIANATVTLAAGGVSYTATTDDDGHYSMTVYQDIKEYMLVTTADKYISDTTSITFNGESMEKNIEIAPLAPDSISSLCNKAVSSDKVYDLQGREVNTTPLPRGIYIRNGRKFIIR